ncbi:Crp/Fnr family transcriptional regulator [Rhizobium sp. MC63]|uniref:Crp/Fnr family transcriptional regulator n=1 Tax=Rhizobium mulingense TaxID=3031128 RepID=A0ACC6MSE9_9HYPH|nr:MULTISPECIES: Crp/Fnr family transcriptional regulator [unclassified Rhizobium]MDF0695882.1 Crp/Fnr family transcriptional regulator [Rhizobium sp. MC63]MEA3516296.1 Crp/Fnr family transcriptional regulator [Rhizobium sp. MJ31]
MAAIDRSQLRNKLLRRFPDDAFNLLAPNLKAVEIPAGRPLVEAGTPIEYIHFIESGLASTVARSVDGKSVEVGQVGYEGLTGHVVLLGSDRSLSDTSMYIRGAGLQMAVYRFLSLLNHPKARLMLLRYVQTCELQFAHSALAAAKYSLDQRLARWLLMCHDRLGGHRLPVTHEFIASMLGVRRSGVTDHLHVLEGLQAIKSTRGVVQILDRRILIETAGGCYGAPEAEYERLIGQEPAEEDIGTTRRADVGHTKRGRVVGTN